jgi:hypothetical protein
MVSVIAPPLRHDEGDTMTAAPEIYPIPSDRTYWLKLEFADRRWAVHEQQLPGPPAEGDFVELGEDGRWEVYGRESVHVRPSGKPDREFFVCRPAT